MSEASEDLKKLVESGKLSPPLARKLEKLTPGVCARHKSWGCGIIRSWDPLGERMTIDFEDKPGHEMKLEFCAKSLEPLPAEHIISRRISEPEVLKEMARMDASGLVAIALKSHGNELLPDQVTELIQGRIVPEPQFKKWWEAAKREMRKNNAFVVPSRRTQPIVLREGEFSHAEELVSAFRDARDLKIQIQRLEEILKNVSDFEKPDEQLRPVVLEIESAASKARGLHPSEAFGLILCRDDLVRAVDGLSASPGAPTIISMLKEEQERLPQVLSGLSASRHRRVLEHVEDAFEEDWIDAVFQLLRSAGPRSVSELTRHLHAKGKDGELNAFLIRGLQDRNLSNEMLGWVCREREANGSTAFHSENVLASVLHALERDYYDEEARGNRLKDLVQNDKELLGDMVADLEDHTVRHLSRRLMRTPVFEELTKRSLLARIIRVHPEIQELVSGEHEKDETKKDDLIVSWESLARRKEELENLVNKEIPENRQEIQVARSYGDLRENFEYKAAKQQQAVLMRRKSELEADLSHARGTDFADPDTSYVSIGTVVELEDADSGEKFSYTILGAWDAVPAELIISYLSSSAQALLGKPVGEEVALPSEGGSTRRVRILGISPHVDPS